MYECTYIDMNTYIYIYIHTHICNSDVCYLYNSDIYIHIHTYIYTLPVWLSRDVTNELYYKYIS